MKLDINGKNYTLKERWRDVSIREMSHAFEVLNNQPPALLKLLRSSEEAPLEIDDSILYRFYIDWIGCFSDIPREVLEGNILLDEPGTHDLKFLASRCFKFLGEPTNIPQINRFRFKKKQYRVINSFTSMTGVTQLLSGATFGDWVNLTSLMAAFDGFNRGKYNALAQVSAVLFSNNFQDKRKETLDKRAQDFLDLDCQTAYAGYFFLEKHINKYHRFLKTSTAAEVRRELGREGLTLKYQNGFIGKLKLFVLLKLESLTEWTKRQSKA
tara:strand:- start:2067 stop:2873 length:807 start_codon:yes stop_codon:yes gene_type:complete